MERSAKRHPTRHSVKAVKARELKKAERVMGFSFMDLGRASDRLYFFTSITEYAKHGIDVKHNHLGTRREERVLAFKPLGQDFADGAFTTTHLRDRNLNRAHRHRRMRACQFCKNSLRLRVKTD